MKANAAKWELKTKELAYKKQLIVEYELEEDVEVLPRYGRIYVRQLR